MELVTLRCAVIAYEVAVWTGDKRGAGTDAKVMLNFYSSFIRFYPQMVYYPSLVMLTGVHANLWKIWQD